MSNFLAPALTIALLSPLCQILVGSKKLRNDLINFRS